MKRSTIYALILCAVVAAACGGSDADAALADQQQYSTAAATAETINGVADPLTSTALLVRDGKRVTADSNGAGS